jgi:F0F1-type ATP synthase membrane subunit c/vacuolar-type H+-ATPase subunit K
MANGGYTLSGDLGSSNGYTGYGDSGFGFYGSDGTFSPMSPATDQYAASSSWASQSSPLEWAQGIGAVFVGAGSLLSSLGIGNSGSQQNPNYYVQPESKNNMLVIGVIVVLIILIVAVALIRRKK